MGLGNARGASGSAARATTVTLEGLRQRVRDVYGAGTASRRRSRGWDGKSVKLEGLGRESAMF